MYAICDMALHLIMTRVQSPEVREFTLEYTRIPDMYFQPQPESYQNTKIYIPSEIFNSNSKITGVTLSNVRELFFSISLSFRALKLKSRHFQANFAKALTTTNTNSNSTTANKTKSPEARAEVDEESSEPPPKRVLRGH